MVAFVTGCAVTPSVVEYNPKKSRALNIAEAGGIYKGVKDAEIPKDTTGALTDSAIYNSMYAGMGFINPGPGLSKLQGLGQGILAAMFEPDSPGARNSFMAWMPAEQAATPAEAQAKMLELFFSATKSVLDEHKIKYNFYYGRDSNIKIVDMRHLASFVIDKDSCGETGPNCSISMNAYEPIKNLTPAFVSKNGGSPSFGFNANGGHKYNGIQINTPKKFPISQVDFYKQISQRMPDWFFIYLSPEKTFDKEGKKIKFPILLEKGEPNLFFVRK